MKEEKMFFNQKIVLPTLLVIFGILFPDYSNARSAQQAIESGKK